MESLSDTRATTEASGRAPVSAFVIAFNEEENIRDCIQSVSFCDEVLVVDSFSTDRTVEIAESLGARVIQNTFDGYREQKTFALSKTTHEWVFNIDADERVNSELRKNIVDVLGRADREEVPNGFYVNRVVYYLDRWWRRGGWYPEYRMRLFRKSQTTWGGVNPHERPIVDGQHETLSGELEHYTYRDMDDQFARLHRFSSIMSLEEFENGKRFSLLKLLGNPVLRFIKFYILKQGFREGIPGLLVALNESFYTYMKYAKLWEHHYLANRDGNQAKESSQR